MKITAWKPSDREGYVTVCDKDDPEAFRWEVSYPNSYNTTLDFDTLFQAERVLGALSNAFEYGKTVAMTDLRRFIGVK